MVTYGSFNRSSDTHSQGFVRTLVFANMALVFCHFLPWYSSTFLSPQYFALVKPPSPNLNPYCPPQVIGTFRSDYVYEIEYEYNFSIPGHLLRLPFITSILFLEPHSISVNNMTVGSENEAVLKFKIHSLNQFHIHSLIRWSLALKTWF